MAMEWWKYNGMYVWPGKAAQGESYCTYLVDQGKKRKFKGGAAWDAIMDPNAKRTENLLFMQMPDGDPILPSATMIGASDGKGGYQAALLEKNGPYPNQRRVIMGSAALKKYQLKDVHPGNTDHTAYHAIPAAPSEGFIYANPRPNAAAAAAKKAEEEEAVVAAAAAAADSGRKCMISPAGHGTHLPQDTHAQLMQLLQQLSIGQNDIKQQLEVNRQLIIQQLESIAKQNTKENKKAQELLNNLRISTDQSKITDALTFLASMHSS